MKDVSCKSQCVDLVTDCVIPFTGNVQTRQIMETAVRLLVVPSWEKGLARGGVTDKGYRIPFMGDENV